MSRNIGVVRGSKAMILHLKLMKNTKDLVVSKKSSNFASLKFCKIG